MINSFYIVLNMRTPSGFETYGRFEVGSDRLFAEELFAQLHGTASVNDTDILHVDLMELKDGLPVNIQVISCTVNEIAVNCKLITKELFKRINLDDKD